MNRDDNGITGIFTEVDKFFVTCVYIYMGYTYIYAEYIWGIISACPVELQGTASARAPRPLPWRVASRPAAARGRRRRSRYNVDRRGEWAKVGFPHGPWRYIVISIVNIYNDVKCIYV